MLTNRIKYQNILFGICVAVVLLAPPLLRADSMVTFRADMTNLIAEGFDNSQHQIEVRGPFNGWQSGDFLEPSGSDPNIFTITINVAGNPGDEVYWKFKTVQEDLYENRGWELGENRPLILGEGSQTLDIITPRIFFKMDTETIAQVRIDSDGDFVPDRMGEAVKIEAHVVSPRYTATASYYFRDATAGIYVYSTAFDSLGLGDKYIVVGYVDQYRGVTELVNPHFEYVASESPPDPTVITIADVGEDWEGQLVQIQNLRYDSGDWPAAGSNAQLWFSDGESSIQVFIDRDTELDEIASPVEIGKTYTITGIQSQFTYSTPPNDNYQLISRYASDFVEVTAGQPNTGSALFDGYNDRIRVLDNAPVDPGVANPDAYRNFSNQITVEAWVFPMEMPENDQEFCIVCRPLESGASARAYALSIINPGTSYAPRFQFNIDDHHVSRSNAAASSQPLDNGRWYHVAGVYNGSTMRLYVDGNLVASTPYTGGLSAGAIGFYIGGWVPNRIGYFNGLIDEVRLWNSARSNDDINGAMWVTLDPGTAGLVGYWPLDEAASVNEVYPVAADATANANHLHVEYGSLFVDGNAFGGNVQVEPTIMPYNLYAVANIFFSHQPEVSGWPKDFNYVLIGAPAGMTINDSDPNDVWIEWTPSESQAGHHDFVLRVTNSAGTTQENYSIWVDAYDRESRIHDNNNIRFTVFNDGHLGARFGVNEEEGDYGFQYSGQNGLYNGSLILGLSGDQISGRLVGDDFSIKSHVNEISDTPAGFDQGFKTIFADERALNPIGLTVWQRSYSKSSSPDDDYVILDYQIINDGSNAINDLYIGLVLDWDVDDAQNNAGQFNSALNLQHVHSTSGQNPNYYGATLIEGNVSGSYFWDNASDADNNDQTLFDGMTTMITDFNHQSDMRAMLSAGPVNIGPGGVERVIFALVAGDNEADLKQNAQAARAVDFGDELTLTLLSPNGGEVWSVGTQQDIRWQIDPSDADLSSRNVVIAGSWDNEANWEVITTTAASAGSFTWTVPDQPSDQCVIWVGMEDDADIGDVSDNTFTISPEAELTLTLLSPNGGEDWTVGTQQVIRWQFDPSDADLGSRNVQIAGSWDNGENWVSIATAAASDGSYTWTVPFLPSDQCLIWVRMQDDVDIGDTSDNTFTISPETQLTLTLLSPNGGEVWQVGTQQEIGWQIEPSDAELGSSNVTIAGSWDNEANWETIATTAASTGSYTWTVPNHPSDECLIWVGMEDDPDTGDASDDLFTISPASQNYIQVINPNGGESWVAETEQEIAWELDFSATPLSNNNVSIELSTDGGSRFEQIAEVNGPDKAYTWAVPNVESDNCLILIASVEDPEIVDVSDGEFSIHPQLTRSVTVVSPNGGEVWEPGSHALIQWQAQNVDNIKIEHRENDAAAWTSLVGSVPVSDNGWDWTIPDISSDKNLIRISATDDDTVFDVSDDYFTIASATEPSVTVIQPNGGEFLQINSPYPVQWDATNIDQISIELSDDNGSNWETIQTGVSASAGEYMMTVPWRASQQALLRIFSEENDAYFDISDDVFTIGDSIAPTISNLMFSEVVSLESDVLIEATITDNPGGINSAKIFYLINGRSQIEQVDMTEGETGQYEGTVPGSDVGLTGLSFIIQAIDNAGNVRLGDRQYIQVECTGGITRTSASGAPVYQPAGNNVDSYRIFSVPLDLTAKSASAFLEANPMIDPYDPEQCRIFSASGSDLVEYPNIGQVRPGKAFLMITNVDNLQIHTPPGKSVNTDGPFVVNSISSGWSLIGNPFNFSLPMDSIRCSVEGVEYWKYSGSWSRNTSGMVPWLGYAVWMPSAGSISFYPGVSGVGKEVDPYVTNASKPETWFLRIQASGSETEDSFTIVGQSQEAVNGYDGLDLHKPPRLQNEVRLALLNSEVSAKREQLAADIRQPDPDGHVWDLQCRLEDGTDRVMLEIHGMEDIPPGFGVWLMDCRQNYVYDLRHRTRIPFQAEAAEVLDFQILAGQQTMLEDLNLPVKMVPSRFALDQNFPNPFNPVTQIRYSLAEDARVRLEIYNMLGRSMALLTDAQQPAGEYVYEWNAGDLPTGIYLIRFQADSYSAMKKCMLIK